MINPKPINKDEAFNQLADALSVNGYAWLRRDQVILIQQARKAIRNNVQVVTELPPLRPQNMVTWVYEFKNISAEQVYREMRILQSNEGEMNPTGNKIVLTDWISNLHRVAKLFAELDKPMTESAKKMLLEFRQQPPAPKAKAPPR